MASPDLATDLAKVTKTKGVLQSVEVYLSGQAARLKAAVDAAMANGATAEELQPFTAEINLMDTEADHVAEAIAANP